MDLGFIDREAGRILGLIALLAGKVDPDAIKKMHPELAELLARRPDGTTARILHLPDLVDMQRLQTEVVAALAGSNASVCTAIAHAAQVQSLDEVDRQLLQGSAIVCADGAAFAVRLPSVPTRATQEPSTERAVFGPKDSFVEPLDQNIALIRSHLRDPRLVAERITLGTDAPTQVAVLYREGSADATQLDEIIARLESYRPPRVGFVSSLLRPLFGPIWTVFLPADFTERPYRAADFLFRGRFVILVDGSPYAMVLPVQFIEYFLDEEEYLQSTATRYFVRGLRFLGFFIALLGPGLYVAILSVNTTVLPGLLAVAVSSNRQSLAFPILTETILMLIVLDIMAEATTAMKGVLGPAISIVGSLIVGQAAVRANLASNLGVILLALTALATFLSPRFQQTYVVRVWKYLFLLVSSVFGLVGWSACTIWLMINLSARRELGTSFLAPLAPLLPAAWDSRSPLQTSVQRVPAPIQQAGRRR
jgi:spore germination protein KA